MAAKTTKFDLRREATRGQLLDAAMHAFHDHGYAATKVDDIVAAIGQTKGAFYFHFANKEDCFLEVVHHRETLRGEWYRIPAALDPATTSLDDVLRQVMGSFARTLQGLNAWVLVMVDFWFHTAQRAETADLFRTIYDGWITELATLVDALKAGGWTTTTQDSRQIATQLFALGEGLTVHATLYDTRPDKTLVDGLAKLLAAR